MAFCLPNLPKQQLGFCLETSQEPLGGGLEPRPEATAFPERPQGGRGWSAFALSRLRKAPSLPPSRNKMGQDRSLLSLRWSLEGVQTGLFG